VALFLAEALPRLLRPAAAAATQGEGERERRLLEHLRGRGACFFPELHAAAGGGFAPETVEALWALVWRGLLTNDTFQPLRAFTRARPGRERARSLPRPPGPGQGGFRSRLATPPAAGGRWTLVEARRAAAEPASATAWSAATAQQLLARYGLVTRGAVAAEGLPGGFSSVYEVFRGLEEAGRIRRGYFVAGVGAMQFALPAALERVRAAREPGERPEVVVLAAADPASPYGASLDWPAPGGGASGRRPARAVGARVVLVDGAPALWVPPARGLEELLCWLPTEEPDRSRVGAAAAQAVLELARAARERLEGVRVEEIDGGPASSHPLASWLERSGFVVSGPGLLLPRRSAAAPQATGAEGP
jgi:ATP-dependent Lhr-like helicase